ncbi:MAG: DUF2071 domain-containing protein, partial [Acidobacteriota bacterium]
HRPWPLPRRPWMMTMSWVDLLFAHWRVEPEVLRRVLPDGLELDTFEDQAYVGLVPFRMENVGPRGLGWLPAKLPGPRAFAELNLRTYVRRGGKPGVWFFSLDAVDPLAVWGARTFFHLPYFHAEIDVRRRDGWVEYRSQRRDRRSAAGELKARYRPIGDASRARRGSLEHWLTERYCLYAVDRRGRVLRGDIQHYPWPLYAAEAEIEVNTVGEAFGLPLEGEALWLHFSPRLDVICWWPKTA